MPWMSWKTKVPQEVRPPGVGSPRSGWGGGGGQGPKVEGARFSGGDVGPVPSPGLPEPCLSLGLVFPWLSSDFGLVPTDASAPFSSLKTKT